MTEHLFSHRWATHRDSGAAEVETGGRPCPTLSMATSIIHSIAVTNGGRSAATQRLVAFGLIPVVGRVPAARLCCLFCFPNEERCFYGDLSKFSAGFQLLSR